MFYHTHLVQPRKHVQGLFSRYRSANMALALRIIASNASTQGYPPFSQIRKFSRVSMKFKFIEANPCSSSSPEQFNSEFICGSTSNGDAHNVSDIQSAAIDHNGFKENNGSQQERTSTSNELMTKLRRYGLSGILSYGLLNTLYYLTTFLLVWLYVSPAPGRMGYAAAVERFLKIMAMVWAGSQVTKLPRIGGAVALAPFVDSGLSWFTTKFGLESRGKAFTAVVAVCFGIALLLFLGVTLLWA